MTTRIAVPRGRLLEHVPDDLRHWWSAVQGSARRLHAVREESGEEYFFMRPKAIPAMVAHGIVDVGYCGSDSVEEISLPAIVSVEHIAAQKGVRMVVAGAHRRVLEQPLDRPLCVGTSYPVIAERFMAARGKAFILVEQPGCVEGLCPSLVDVVVDVVETGETLHDNGLLVIEDLGELSVVKLTRMTVQ